jgi:protein-disulfide isomerase
MPRRAVVRRSVWWRGMGVADRKFAADVLKVDGTPTFFIRSHTIVGAAAFEEFDNKIKSLLKS